MAAITLFFGWRRPAIFIPWRDRKEAPTSVALRLLLVAFLNKSVRFGQRLASFEEIRYAIDRFKSQNRYQNRQSIR
ncbi:MAG TPA: hypothetical protein VNM15_00780 [Candidatus Binatia bacterium]|nr:hypothetical protein [Candidatus Binatia bacterium]